MQATIEKLVARGCARDLAESAILGLTPYTLRRLVAVAPDVRVVIRWRDGMRKAVTAETALDMLDDTSGLADGVRDVMAAS
jgi:hypothetical protein